MSHSDVDKLITMLNEQNKKLDEHLIKFENYVKIDTEWKDEVKPSIEIMKNIENFGKGTMWLLKAVIALGGAFGVLYAIIKYLKN